MPKLCKYGVADFQDYVDKSSISQSTTLIMSLQIAYEYDFEYGYEFQILNQWA